jgi:hypothetical protein
MNYKSKSGEYMSHNNINFVSYVTPAFTCISTL